MVMIDRGGVEFGSGLAYSGYIRCLPTYLN